MSGAKKIVVLDYGSGNVRSVAHALERVGAQAILSSDEDQVMLADGLVVPGVGAFSAVMEALRAGRFAQMVERRLAGGRAVLGICVGLQVMFESGDEHGVEVEGLGQWPGAVTRLEAPRLPHMGWSPVHAASGSALLAGLDAQRFYFVHSYGCLTDPSQHLGDGMRFRKPLVSWAHHGSDFVAAVENGPLCATQFHPEKSGEAGAALFKNWLSIL